MWLKRWGKFFQAAKVGVFGPWRCEKQDFCLKVPDFKKRTTQNGIRLKCHGVTFFTHSISIAHTNGIFATKSLTKICSKLCKKDYSLLS